MSTQQLKILKRGQVGEDMITGLRSGEVCFVGTDRGVFEVSDAIQRNLGGEVLLRAS